jgi:hypothetical protein
MNFKKIIPGALLATFLSLSLLSFCLIAKAPQATSMQGEDLIQLDQVEIASVSADVTQLAPKYQDSKIFLSQVYEADHEFQLLGLNWGQDLPSGTDAYLEIRFREADVRATSSTETWTNWQEIEDDQDGARTGDGLWTYIITNNADAFQYRANLSTLNSSTTPKLTNITFDYIDGGQQSLLSKAASTATNTAKLIFQQGSSVVDREDWGANEDYTLASYHNYDREAEGDDWENELDEDDLEEDPDMEIIETVWEDEDGNELLWPQEYPRQVKKIIVHHTATTDDLDDPDQAMRAIYYYHAVSRGWGDIGYNYIIAPNGQIYEGRAGGDGVVAGHAQGYNTGSLGIAVLGDYDENPISGDAVQSLADLIYEKSKLFDIDPDGESEFRGEDMPNVIGHRDVSATACPGDYIYEIMEELTEMVGSTLDNAEDSSSGSSSVSDSDQDFAYSDSSNLELVTLEPMDSAGLIVRIKNTGTETWTEDTFLTVNSNYSAEKIATIEKDENKAIDYLGSEVEPGETAKFTFHVESEMVDGLAHFEVVPVFNGEEKADRAMDLGVYVERPQIDFDVVSVDAPEYMHPGDTETVTISLENEGNFTWGEGEDTLLYLKRNGSSKLFSSTKIAQIGGEVKPGQETSFEFEIEAPDEEGSYSLYYTLAMDEDSQYESLVHSSGSAQISVQVVGDPDDPNGNDDAKLKEISDDMEFMPGEKKLAWIRLKNMSTEKWSTSSSSSTDADDETFNLLVSAPSGVEVSTPKMTVRTLSPGITAKIYFYITAPDEGGDYEIDLRPRLGSANLTNQPFEIEFEVTDDLLSTSTYKDPIRIRLTPDEEIDTPIMTSSDSFIIYDDEELIKSFSGSSRVRVTPQFASDASSEKAFKITSGSYSYEVDGPVRFTSNEEDGVLKISNMEQRPAWNPDLNDNEFRGTIEFQKIEASGSASGSSSSHETAIINELPLEDYLKGVAEVPDGTPEEKAKAMSVIARSYAYYYMTRTDEDQQKFPGLPYHLDDDPDSSQKYLGYGFEERSSIVPDAVEDTAGVIVTYADDSDDDSEVVKTAYFNQSDGVATKSAYAVWAWTDTPWLASVADTYCQATSFNGHGVGLSGCGAEAMAEQGFTFEEIIKYYYTGVELGEI